MAKSKNGGTRSLIRGRVGSDVYSVGKDGNGKRQQVVRSLAESVANPRTEGQMFGRMIMSTVMQTVSALSPIIDHSFDGIAKGQPNISEFIRLNYAKVKADALAHPASGNYFGLNKYQEKGAKAGSYIISKGSAVVPAAVRKGSGGLDIVLSNDAHTVGDLKAALGLSADGFLTCVLFGDTSKQYKFVRVHLTTTLVDSTEITASNVGGLFTLEGVGSWAATFAVDTISIEVSGESLPTNWGVIVSEKVDGAWIHSTCTLDATASAEFASDAALPTYPVGTEDYLNGGDL